MTRLTREQTDAFQAELDALRDETTAKIGEQDARHLRRVVRTARGSAVAGRSLLMFGFDPITWLLGTLALALAKILDNMEIGHNVMHGQYDWMNDPQLNSKTFEWDIVCDAGDWKHYHNYEHHTHTNILGKDHDLGYGMLRVSDRQKWSRFNLLQPLWYALLALLFQWGVGIHDAKAGRWLMGKMSREEFQARIAPFLAKTKRQLFKDYVLFPLIGFWNAPRILLGNLVANGIRNVWTNAVIFCGHFAEGVRVYSRSETMNETRGDWYLRQLQGSCNIEGSKLMYLMTGHLSHQIEHHIFPDIPAPRYQELGPRVREICARYGVPYNSASFARQYGSVLWTLFRLSFPPKRRTADVAVA
jgi:linoleoyl-CoA desaturase